MDQKATEDAPELSQGTSSFIETIAQRLGASANTKAVYGDPVEKDGVTVIPVAKVGYGFGGGWGHGKSDDEGYGGGGGLGASPVGYIQIKEGRSQFRRIPRFDWVAFALGLLAGAWLFTRRHRIKE